MSVRPCWERSKSTYRAGWQKVLSTLVAALGQLQPLLLGQGGQHVWPR